jgi:hypothetical protein
VGAAQQSRLPIGVAAVALFEFARAALILLVALGFFPSSQLSGTSTSTVQVVTLTAFSFYVPRNEAPDRLPLVQDPAVERSDRIIGTLVGAPLAVLFSYIGLLLILRKKRGRELAIVWSGMTVLYWLRGLLISWGFGDTGSRYFTSAQTKQSIMMALGLNALVALYLVYGVGVAEAFMPKKQKATPRLDVIDEGESSPYS